MATTSDSVTSLTLLRRLRDSPDDQQSWEEFVDRYGGMIQGWCLSWGLQEADALDVTGGTQVIVTGLMDFAGDSGPYIPS